MKTILISACLLGVNCKYNGQNNTNEKLLNLIDSYKCHIVPVCPEQLGGLSTPRLPCEIVYRFEEKVKILNDEGFDVTKNFVNGAEECLKIVELFNIRSAILKERSPSCGNNFIYDGSFTHSLIKGKGILAQKLIEKGIDVKSEEEDFSLIFQDNN